MLDVNHRLVRRAALRRPAMLALGVASVAVHAATLARLRGPDGAWPTTPDALLFEYTGWLWVHSSKAPYRHVWDVKPPAIHLTTAAAAAVTHSPEQLHRAATLVGLAASVAVPVLVAGLVVERTRDRAAGALAGLAVLAYAGSHYAAALGIRPKPLVLVAGLGGLWLVERDRPATGLVVATLAPAFWQLGVVFPAVAAGMVARRRRWRGLARGVAGAAVVAAAVVAPVVANGALLPMLGQVVVVPIAIPDPGGPLHNAATLLRLLAWWLPIGGVAAVGVGRGVVGDRGPVPWWAGALLAWFGFQALVLDMDGHPDAVPVVVAAALCLGFAAAAAGPWARRAVGAWVAAALVVSAVLLGGAGVVVTPVDDYSNDGRLQATVAAASEAALGRDVTQPPYSYVLDRGIYPTDQDRRVTELLWGERVTDRCHIRLSGPERAVISSEDAIWRLVLRRETCGPTSWTGLQALTGIEPVKGRP